MTGKTSQCWPPWRRRGRRSPVWVTRLSLSVVRSLGGWLQHPLSYKLFTSVHPQGYDLSGLQAAVDRSFAEWRELREERDAMEEKELFIEFSREVFGIKDSRCRNGNLLFLNLAEFPSWRWWQRWRLLTPWAGQSQGSRKSWWPVDTLVWRVQL